MKGAFPELGEPRPLSKKEATFLKLWFETGDVANAVLESKLWKPKKSSKAKPSSNKITAASIGSRLLKEIAPTVDEMLNAAGLSKMEVLKSLKEGLGAEETVRVRVMGDNGKERTEIHRYPDFKARAKYQEMALKAHMILVNTPTIVNNNTVAAQAQAAAGIARMHRESLEGKSPDELHAILEEEDRARSSIRLVHSSSKRGT